MALIIDGNNVLGFTGWDEERLIQRISRYAALGKHRVELHFDGARDGNTETRHIGRLRVNYSGYRTADQLILDFVQSQQSAHQWQLVSNDRKLVQDCRFHGIKQWRVEQFRSLLEGFEREKQVQQVAVEKPAFEADVFSLAEAMLKRKK